MYKILSFLFWGVRQFVLPNPFEVFGDGIPVSVGGASLLLTPNILNWIASLVLPIFTFTIVGIYYSRGSSPSLGSALYMLFFGIHCGFLYLISYSYPNLWLIALIIALYIGMHFVTSKLFR